MQYSLIFGLILMVGVSARAAECVPVERKFEKVTLGEAYVQLNDGARPGSQKLHNHNCLVIQKKWCVNEEESLSVEFTCYANRECARGKKIGLQPVQGRGCSSKTGSSALIYAPPEVFKEMQRNNSFPVQK